jgi:hypothetical protein
MVSARLLAGQDITIPIATWSAADRRDGAAGAGIHSFGDYRMAFERCIDRTIGAAGRSRGLS